MMRRDVENHDKKRKHLGDVELETVYRESTRPSAEAEGGGSYCPPFQPRTYIVEPGIICEQDVAVTLRDGVTMYTDIYLRRRKASLRSSPGAPSASGPAMRPRNGSSWGCRREPFPR